MPRFWSWRITRARPLSTTARTPGTVTLLSATLVASTTLRRSPSSRARSCTLPSSRPCSSTRSRPSSRASPSIARLQRAISPTPGKNTSTSPSPSDNARRVAETTRCSSVRPDSLPSQWVSTANARPCATTCRAPGKNCISGSSSSVADITTNRSSGRTVSRTSWTIARARSPSRLRSWNSSNTTVWMPSKKGSRKQRRTSTPSVTKRTRVAFPARVSSRT